MGWLGTASGTSSTAIRAASSPARPSPACSPTTASQSAWTARAPGATTYSSNACGAASNTRRSICGPTTASARHAHRSGATSNSTIVDGRMRALTTQHPIKPTSLRCHSAWQPNPGRGSTYRRGKSVQTTGATSDHVIGLERGDAGLGVRVGDKGRAEVFERLAAGDVVEMAVAVNHIFDRPFGHGPAPVVIWLPPPPLATRARPDH